MTPQEFEYIKRAVQQLEKPIPVDTRVKIQKTMAQILDKSATKMERDLVDSLKS
jgi:hypothetical protein